MADAKVAAVARRGGNSQRASILAALLRPFVRGPAEPVSRHNKLTSSFITGFDDVVSPRNLLTRSTKTG